MSQGLPNRKDVSSLETWDLKDLFQNDDAFYETLEEIMASTIDFNKRFAGQLTNYQIAEKALDEYESLLIQLDRLGNYSVMKQHNN